MKSNGGGASTTRGSLYSGRAARLKAEQISNQRPNVPVKRGLTSRLEVTCHWRKAISGISGMRSFDGPGVINSCDASGTAIVEREYIATRTPATNVGIPCSRDDGAEIQLVSRTHKHYQRVITTSSSYNS